MSSLLARTKNIASVKAGDKTKDYTVVILALKTTKREDESEIIQISFLLDGHQKGIYDEYFLPKNGLSFESMAQNRITEEMLYGKQSIWESSIALDKLRSLNTEDNYLVLHSGNSIIQLLRGIGIECKMKVVDTYQISKALLKDANRHTLSTLYFQYGLYRKFGTMEKSLNEDYNVSLRRLGSHHTFYRIVELKFLLDLLYEKAGSMENLYAFAQENNTGIKTKKIEKKNLKSEVAVMMTADTQLTFGKHKGKTPREILKIDRGYLEWMTSNADDLSHELKKIFNELLK